MAQKAIIHTATRVIRRLTTNDSPVLSSDETSIEMITPIDLAGGPWKLDIDNTTKLVPTQQEIDDSDVDQSRVSFLQQQFKESMNTLVSQAETGRALLQEKALAVNNASTNQELSVAIKDFVNVQLIFDEKILDWLLKQNKLMKGLYR